MTNLERKAMEMALKFCEDIGELSGPYPYVNGTGIVSDSRKVSQTLRQALDKPEIDQQALVQMAVLAEREACAKVCDDADKSTHPADLADAIRARGEK